MRHTLRTLPIVLLTLCGAVTDAAIQPPPAVSPESPGQGEVNLRPKFRKGDQTRFIMTIDSTGQTRSADATPSKEKPRPDRRKPATGPNPKPVDEPAEDQTIKQEIGLLLRVKEANPEKGATVELVYESIKLDMRSGEMEFTFDSSKKAAKPGPKPAGDPAAAMPTEQDMIDAMMRPMVGATITLEIDADGNITRATGGSALSMAGMLGSLNALTGSAMPSAGGGDDVMGSLFSVAKGRGSARIGETWTTTDKLEGTGIGSFTLTNKTTLKSHARGVADLAFEGKLVPGSSESGAGLLGGSAQVKESDFTGRAAWDTERGMLKTMNSDQRIVMEASIPDPDSGQKDVSMTNRTRVSVKRID